MVERDEYIENITSDIEATIGERECQPILFMGTGISKRYFSAPDWDGLLKRMVDECNKGDKNYGYYRQTRDEKEAAELIADHYAEWAWDRNESRFNDEELLDYAHNKSIYLKIAVSEFLSNKCPDSIEDITEDDVADDLTLDEALNEIRLLQEIQPHAVITTNYDQLLERVFNDSSVDGSDESSLDSYRVVVGEEVLHNQYQSLGEILKIHGSTTDPQSLILTEGDYEQFNSRKRYLSSKMLTYFVEHPLLIVGYSASDPNVRSILSWVNDIDDSIVSDDIYFLKYKQAIDSWDDIPPDRKIQLNSGDVITVKNIVASDFDWVFKAFASGKGFDADVKYLRKLVANMYEVVRNAEPRGKVVDHQNIEDIAKDTDELANVLGISPVGDSPGVQLNHPYGTEDLYDRIDVNSPHALKRDVLLPIYEEHGVRLTGFNNRYHVAFFEGWSDPVRRFSEDAVELFDKVINGEEYELNIHSPDVEGEALEERSYDLESIQ